MRGWRDGGRGSGINRGEEMKQGGREMEEGGEDVKGWGRRGKRVGEM